MLWGYNHEEATLRLDNDFAWLSTWKKMTNSQEWQGLWVDQQTYYNSQNVFVWWPNGLKKLLHILKQASIEGKLSQLPLRVLAWENNFNSKIKFVITFTNCYFIESTMWTQLSLVTMFMTHAVASMACIYIIYLQKTFSIWNSRHKFCPPNQTQMIMGMSNKINERGEMLR